MMPVMRQVRILPRADVRAARDHPALRRGHRTIGDLTDPQAVRTASGERRRCRSCGFPVGEDELILVFDYTWSSDDGWGQVSTVVLHIERCRHGAAHEMVLCGGRNCVEGKDLDEVDQAILALRATGLSDRQIASMVGSTSDSISTLLRRLTRRLKLVGDDHTRQTLAAVEEQSQTSESAAERWQATLDELLR